ncbi:MAG TPA: ParB/RepB/Spo0J family partition protein [Geobacteraceae bacterium]|nr:ParB/RepB/Spo0J family partition protein [Geobacteraceae bacterium]
MIKKTGLGKGMGALLPVVEKEQVSYFLCPIEDVKPNRAQPRKTFTSEKLEELAASIREKGIIQPIVVIRKGAHYEIIAGERRWRAAQKAGLHEVPVVIQDVSENTALEMALIENIQREDLNAVEEAHAYRSLMETIGLSQEEMAKRVGKDRSTVANSLRLLKLPEDVQRDIIAERLTMGHARALLSLEDVELIRRAREEIVKKHVTVRGAESLVRRLKNPPVQKGGKRPERELVDLVEQLKRRFQAKVDIKAGSRGGKIEISYSGREELARIVELLGI